MILKRILSGNRLIAALIARDKVAFLIGAIVVVVVVVRISASIDIPIRIVALLLFSTAHLPVGSSFLHVHSCVWDVAPSEELRLLK